MSKDTHLLYHVICITLTLLYNITNRLLSAQERNTIICYFTNFIRYQNRYHDIYLKKTK